MSQKNETDGEVIIELISLKELSEIAERERAERIRRGRWGPWRINWRKKTLSINRAYLYEIDLDEIKREGPLKWLAHLREKAWLKRGDVEDLIACFDDLFGFSWLWCYVSGHQGIHKERTDEKNPV
jgi:hypothetical protein